MLEALAQRGAEISYHDPLVPEVEIGRRTFSSVDLTDQALDVSDIVIILVPQSNVDWERVAEGSRLVFDCCNALKKKSATIHRL